MAEAAIEARINAAVEAAWESRRLPTSLRDHVAAADHKTAAAMAAHADLLWDARSGGSVAAIADSLAAMSIRDRSKLPQGSRRRSPERRQPDSGRARQQTPDRRGRPDSRNRNRDPTLCFYHDRFGKKAHQCEAPCTWTKN